ncbi:MAG TPA: uroporphyrinogen-III synthase [Bacillales bacterium]|nr:uroporphyrinogen-III synthase [Bacillales bacterium]
MTCPLEGKRILVTRATGQAETFSREIMERGGEPIEVPVIAFLPPEEPTEIKKVLGRLEEYHWVIFTSANGVRFFFEELKKAGLAFPSTSKVAAVGKKTWRILRKYDARVDIVPDEFIAESLLEALKAEVQPGEMILMPRGNLARMKLSDGLTEWGAVVDHLTVYRTVMNGSEREKLLELLAAGQVDIATFTSSSTVVNFFELLEGTKAEKLVAHMKFACIGPVTAETARKYGIEPEIIPEEYSISGLLNAMEQFYD